MGSIIKINHILRLTSETGMPASPVEQGRYTFTLPGERLFQFAPTKVTLVHDVGGKWRVIGQAQVMKQTLDAEAHMTSGEFVIVRLFPEQFVQLASYYEAPDGESYYQMDEV